MLHCKFLHENENQSQLLRVGNFGDLHVSLFFGGMLLSDLLNAPTVTVQRSQAFCGLFCVYRILVTLVKDLTSTLLADSLLLVLTIDKKFSI